MSDTVAERAWDPGGDAAGGGQPPRGPVWRGRGPGDPGVRRIRARYETDGTPLLLLALWTTALTVVTFGLYRFWMVTRLRRHYWRAVRVDGDPFEYTGTGLERLLGFLVAVVVLAIYLGLVNLALTFIGLSYLDGHQSAVGLSLLSALPLYYFAAYRAKRYIMARTRWRAIRFGMENAAWGYAARALGYLVPAVASLGLLYPLMHFRLTRYTVGRTWFGDLRFEQGGSWTRLLRRWIWVYPMAGIAALGGYAAATSQATPTVALLALLAGLGGVAIAVLVYHVAAFRYLWRHRSLGGVRFDNDISAAGVLAVYVGGGTAVALCTLLATIALLLGLTVVAALALDPQSVQAINQAMRGDVEAQVLQVRPVLLVGVLFYVLIFTLVYALGQVFITRPIIRRMAEGMTIVDPDRLALSRQRPHDAAVEAGGFADALGVDVGAGF